MKRIILSEAYWLDIDVTDSGIPDQKTLSLYATFPLAQNPRAQRIAQITGPISTIWDVATSIHTQLIPKHHQ